MSDIVRKRKEAGTPQGRAPKAPKTADSAGWHPINIGYR